LAPRTLAHGKIQRASHAHSKKEICCANEEDHGKEEEEEEEEEEKSCTHFMLREI